MSLIMECTAVKLLLMYPKGRPGVFKKKRKLKHSLYKTPCTPLHLQIVGLLIDNDVVVGCSSEEGVYVAADYGGA